VAASAPAQRIGDAYRYSYDDARNFAISVSPEYQVYTATVGTTSVLSYAFSFHAAAGQAALQTTAEALELYNRLFGPYPRPLLSVVEADFLDGMEYDGLYFLSNGFYNLYQGTPGEYLVAIAAHETAHQWFYARVGNDQALEPWLDEALCTYSERLFYENVHPDALQWWWDYRVKYYQPQGWVDGSIYNPAGYRAYRDAVYLNGAIFLEELRKQVGDEVFFAFLRDYVAQMSDQIATREDFFRILGEHAHTDIVPLLKNYFQGN
jgi:aminopeptidase N